MVSSRVLSRQYQNPLVSPQSAHIDVIVPSVRGNTEKLQAELDRQSRPPDRVTIIRGVSPNGKARNLGVSHASNGRQPQPDDILIFIDDDALPGHPDLVAALTAPLLADPSLGITGAARVLPPNAPSFQIRVAREIPRTVNPIPQQPLETDPPLSGYGHSLITTTCCAIRRNVFEAAGMFSEVLTSGVDTDFFYRVRNLGYRFEMVPHVHVIHPAPGNLRSLLSKYYWYGQGYAQEARRRPIQKMGPRLPTLFHQVFFITAATLWVVPNIVILYSYGYPRFRLGFRPLKALSTYAVAWGYFRGWRQKLPVEHEHGFDPGQSFTNSSHGK